MVKRGVATFTLDTGQCPRWLFERMARLGGQVAEIIVEEFGPDEFIRRLGDPAWFQSLGTVLAFDWNASGLTTILTAALKESLRGRETRLGLFICGGKGRTSRRTPQEIASWGQILGLSENRYAGLAYNSRMAAKVDSALVQDGYQIYHHAFFFSRNGAWAVVQQGMNTGSQTARRYHWSSERVTDLVCEPHSGIITQRRNPTLDLTARASTGNRQLSLDLVRSGHASLEKEIKVLRRYWSNYVRTLAIKSGQQEMVFLELADREFHWHPVAGESFRSSPYLDRILARVCERNPESYETMLSLAGVGPRTMRALSLVAEVIYGARPSYEDPARYSFAHGGKDATPYPVDRATYDRSIEFFERVIRRMRIGQVEKDALLKKISRSGGR
ncbi:MAG: hypothetical protein BWY73_01205 [candidate division TA06 bacterium ADurb.Bin417]|uniref:DUF763 domain-containing protein n=1 Tax=candidate division TA06 bacterium ADurb.Bin417 TaxID=1852828 RepID=A0A1V5MCM5_UNCT6|nr:MAG: hypothetical protein BWY73_01205 [candidate division TA06 bacterium ADurb.Bin417]